MRKFLPIIISPASTGISLFIFLIPIFVNYFTNEFIIGSTIIGSIIFGSIGEPGIDISTIHPPNFTILEIGII